VVWDGTGYGEDKQSWGGEFFTYENHSFRRETHLSYIPVWQGDTMALEPRLSALFLCRDFLKDTPLRSKFSDTEWSYYLKLIQTKPILHTSSIGRLFDAIAAMLNVTDYNTYEGEAAMLLEAKATQGKCLSRYHIIWKKNSFDAEALMKQIITDLDHQVPVERIAYKFHVWLADVIHEVAVRMRIKNIALSGGVFQNALLIDLIDERMSADYRVFLNKELSANDENISLGQLAGISIKRKQEQRVLAENHY
jgi:hydrogenase maturation protein HypF